MVANQSGLITGCCRLYQLYYWCYIGAVWPWSVTWSWAVTPSNTLPVILLDTMRSSHKDLLLTYGPPTWLFVAC